MPTVGIVMPLAEQRGGAELLLLQLLQANEALVVAGEAGCRYAVAFLEDGPMVAAVRTLGVQAEVFDAGRVRQVGRQVGTVRRIAAWLRALDADAALAWMPKGHLYSGPAALLARIPAFWFQHTITSKNPIHRTATLLPSASILCCSEAAKAGQATLWPPRHAEVLYPAVNLARFDADALPSVAALRAKLDLPTDAFVAGIVGRLQHWKGIHVFVEAAAQVARAHPDAVFVVVGGPHFSEPDYPGELAALAERHGIGDQLRFVGHQPNVPEWMNAFDVLVHASTGPEPFGMVILEGMALGKPVVATAHGGPLEIVTPESGLLVPPGEPDALADVLRRLAADPAARAHLADGARARAAQFSTERLARDAAALVRRHLA
ncbi:MAG: glycosyltransferase [Bacteroidota bacterium]